MRICQIGCGNHARHVYKDSLLRCRKEMPVTYTACCDTDTSRAQAYAHDTGFVNTYVDYQAMLQAEKPDAVLITTPYTVTARVATELLTLGIPALIEKPPAETLAEVLALRDLSVQTGTLHQVAYNRRHMPLIRALAERMVGGSVRHIDYQMNRVRRTESYFETTAAHGFDLVSYLAGAPLAAMQATYQELSPGVINVSMLCTYQNGVTASMRFQPVSQWMCEQVQVATDQAFYAVDLPIWGARAGGGQLVQYENNAVTETLTDADFEDGEAMFASNGFYAQVRAFFEAVQAGRTPHTLSSAIDAAILCECMRTRQTAYTAV